MAQANPLRGAPCIHGELLKLGIDVCQATVAKYVPRRRRPPSPDACMCNEPPERFELRQVTLGRTVGDLVHIERLDPGATTSSCEERPQCRAGDHVGMSNSETGLLTMVPGLRASPTRFPVRGRCRFAIPVLIVVCFSCATLSAQRHGRADSVQNYLKAVPDATITVQLADRTARWRARDLVKLPESVFALPVGRVRATVGIDLSQLLPQVGTPADIDGYEIHYGFFHTRRLQAFDLQHGSKIIVTNDANGPFLNRVASLHVLVTMRSGEPVDFKNVYRIVVRARNVP
jgi:hypothetical protein